MTRKSKLLSKLLHMSSLCLLTVLSACASAAKAPLAVTVASDGCKAFKQLSWSVDDTPQTATEIRRHNRTYAELCRPAK